MAPRTSPRIFDLGPYGGAPMVNLAAGRVTRRRGKRVVRNPLATPGEFRLPTTGGLRILRNQRTNTMGVRDLVVDRSGRVVANLRTGANPQLRFVGEGPNRRLVVGRAGAPAPGAAPTGGGAGRTLAGVTNDPNLYKSASDPVLWTGRGQPRQETLNSQFGQGNWYVEQSEDGKYVVKRRDNSPYAMYNQYPFVRRYLEDMDRGYDQFQNYLTNTYNPMVTAGSKALTDARLASGNAYNAAIQNYSNAAGNVASAMAPAQVAGMTGGTVQAPNMNALGAAQSMAASANVGRNLDAGYRTALGGLEAEKMGQSFQSAALGYGAGLLNQYGQKRVQERLKMDQWIEEQKAAQAKLDLDMARLDQSMINSLIVSGDRAAARDVTTRGQDLTDARGQADDARADAAAEDKYSNRGLERDGWIRLPKGAGTRGLQVTTSNEGVKYYKPRKGGGGGGGGSGGGSGPTPSERAARMNDFTRKWSPPRGLNPDTDQPYPAPWGNGAQKYAAAASWIKSNINLFPGLKKGNRKAINAFLLEAGISRPDIRRRLIDQAIQLIARG